MVRTCGCQGITWPGRLSRRRTRLSGRAGHRRSHAAGSRAEGSPRRTDRDCARRFCRTRISSNTACPPAPAPARTAGPVSVRCAIRALRVASELRHWTAGPCRRRAGATSVRPVHGPLVGRESELAAVGRFVGGHAAGPASLTLAGEAGIGKTAIWTRAVQDAQAAGVSVRISRCSEPDAALSFAGLGDLFDGLRSVGAWRRCPPSSKARCPPLC